VAHLSEMHALGARPQRAGLKWSSTSKASKGHAGVGGARVVAGKRAAQDQAVIRVALIRAYLTLGDARDEIEDHLRSPD
jgi:hypothetical protein